MAALWRAQFQSSAAIWGEINGTGTGTSPVVTNITAGDTTAVVTYAGTATHYRLNGGSSVAIGASPHTITGMTANTEYTIELTGDGSTWGASTAFGTDNSANGSGEIGAQSSVPVFRQHYAQQGIS